MTDKKKAVGGVARAKSLTPERRSEIAAKAAGARWGEKPVRATHKGNFEADFGIDVECYVLDDDQKTAVISQRGMGAALGMRDTSGLALTRFLSGVKMTGYVGAELREKLSNPLKFQWSPPGVAAGVAAGVLVHGYDVTMLIDVCKAILAASAASQLVRAEHIVRQAQVIVNASAKAGIKGLVYALAGFDATKEQVIGAFKFYVREEAREYEKEFPDQLYKEWYRLYGCTKPEKNKPWKFMHLTRDQVYYPLAKSSGRILELTKAKRDESGDGRKKLHQFLSQIGVKALRTHLGQLLGIAQVSRTREEYEQHVAKIFGRQQSLSLKEP